MLMAKCGPTLRAARIVFAEIGPTDVGEVRANDSEYSAGLQHPFLLSKKVSGGSRREMLNNVGTKADVCLPITQREAFPDIKILNGWASRRYVEIQPSRVKNRPTPDIDHQRGHRTWLKTSIDRARHVKVVSTTAIYRHQALAAIRLRDAS
jgi:hypothetical protein